MDEKAGDAASTQANTSTRRKSSSKKEVASDAPIKEPSPNAVEESPTSTSPATVESEAPKIEQGRRSSRRKSSLKKDASTKGEGANAKQGTSETTSEEVSSSGTPTAKENESTTPSTEQPSLPESETAATKVEGGTAAAQTKAPERKASLIKRKSSVKKPASRKSSVAKKDGSQLDEDDEEEAEIPKIIYPIDPKMQEILRRAWTLLIKKGQKKKTEIAEIDLPTVMRSIAINPTEAQVKEIIAYTRSQDVSTTSKGFLTYECFEQRMAEYYQLDPNKYNRNSKDKILVALQTLTGGSSKINGSDFKKIMMTKGDCMTEQEAALMIRNVGDRDTHKVYVEEYADLLSKDGIPQPLPDPTVW